MPKLKRLYIAGEGESVGAVVSESCRGLQGTVPMGEEQCVDLY